MVRLNCHALSKRHGQWVGTCAYSAALEAPVPGLRGAKQRTSQGNTVDKPVTCLPICLIRTDNVSVGHENGILSLECHRVIRWNDCDLRSLSAL